MKAKSLPRHSPLPYTVVLRVSVGDDTPATSIEKDVIAYSLEEAVYAACYEIVGVLPDGRSNVVIEKAAPNLRRWFEMLAQGLISP